MKNSSQVIQIFVMIFPCGTRSTSGNANFNIMPTGPSPNPIWMKWMITTLWRLEIIKIKISSSEKQKPDHDYKFQWGKLLRKDSIQCKNKHGIIPKNIDHKNKNVVIRESNPDNHYFQEGISCIYERVWAN